MYSNTSTLLLLAVTVLVTVGCSNSKQEMCRELSAHMAKVMVNEGAIPVIRMNLVKSELLEDCMGEKDEIVRKKYQNFKNR